MPRSRKLCAIMFTDIEGYTSLMQKSEEQAIKMRDQHRHIFESKTEVFHGKIIQYFGDGTLSIFESVVSAVLCGISLQKEFLQEPIIPVRIGVHIGDIIITEDDIIGDSVNIASRIESLAIPGSVLISDKVNRELNNHRNIKTVSLGEFNFKNDHKPREVFYVDEPGLAVISKELLNKQAKLSPAQSKAPFSKPTKLSHKYFRRIFIPFLLVIGIVATLLYRNKNSITNENRNQLLEEIDDLSEELSFVSGQSGEGINAWKAYELALQVEESMPGDPMTNRFWSKFAQPVSIKTEPEGANVFAKAYESNDSSWLFLGKSPLDSIKLSYGYIRLKIIKDGFPIIEDVIWNTAFLDRKYTYKLLPDKDLVQDMVFVQPPTHPHFLMGTKANTNISWAGEFFMDKTEVSNSAYQVFVDSGGYQRPEYWTYPFVDKEKEISWTEAMTKFSDKTSLSGPANWVAGRYPEGEGAYPVGGISWYEAAAYANFVGKQLPSVYHWRQASGIWMSSAILPKSNMENNKPISVHESKSLNRYGVINLAGNAREWVFNEIGTTGERLILGGGWDDPLYLFNAIVGADPFDRYTTNGFRCIVDIHDQEDAYDEKMLQRQTRDYPNIVPVKEETFKVLKQQFSYAEMPLNAEIESSVEEEFWTKKRVFFDAAYSNERMSAYLFLPKKVDPPYQTVVFWPGANAVTESYIQIRAIDFLIKNGRAVMYPIYKNTYDRRIPNLSEQQKADPYLAKEHLIKQVKDLKRSIDYLEARTDIDTSRLAYMGVSWGGGSAPIVLSVEKRLKAAVLVATGLFDGSLSEVDPVNYIGRVNTPTLILNGRYDQFNPFQDAQIPFYELLGTPDAQKKFIAYDKNHHVPKTELIKETLKWYNHYLGSL